MSAHPASSPHAHRGSPGRPPTPSSSSTADLACRIGYAAHGAVYLLVGAFAVDAAFGGGGERAQGSAGAIADLGRGTLGTVLLTILGVGLLGYAFLRLWQGLANPAQHDHDAKGIGIRIGRVASGLMQGALSFYALSLAYGWFSEAGGGMGGSSGGSSGGGRASDLTARLMSMDGGRWLVGAIGVGIVVAAFMQLKRAITASFLGDLRIDAQKRQWVEPLGRAAFSARFVVFLVVGGFILAAAWQVDPDEARGLGGALRTLREQPYGPWLLGLVGVGLICFAVIRGVYAGYAVLPRNDRRHA